MEDVGLGIYRERNANPKTQTHVSVARVNIGLAMEARLRDGRTNGDRQHEPKIEA